MNDLSGRTQIKMEHECFIPVAKHKIIEALTKLIDDPQIRDQFADFCRLIEAIYHFSYHEILKELKQDFALFDVASRDDELIGRKPREVDDAEDRFLRNFCTTLEKGNFRPLTQQDIDVAELEDYLFNLPVTIDWDKLDYEMLPKFFSQNGAGESHDRPSFFNRILIYQRGTGVEKHTGYLLLQKIDILISRMLVWGWRQCRRLWPMLRRGPVDKPDEPEGAEAAVANDLRPGQTHIHEDRYVERIPLRSTGGGLGWLFQKSVIQEPTFQELILLFRFAEAEEDDPPDAKRAIHIKTFRDIPMADLEVVFPEKKISMQPLDLVKLVITGTIGVVVVLFKLVLTAALNPFIAAAALFTLCGYGAKVFVGFKASKDRYQHLVTNSLYHKNLDNDGGVISYLVDSLEEQEFKEAVLAYYFLWRLGDAGEEDLDGRCEGFLKDTFDIEVDFEVHDAVEKLVRDQLITRHADQFQAVPLEEALERLDYKWDNFFQYNDN